MDRRQFVRLLGMGLGVAAVPNLVRLSGGRGGPEAIFFYVAGARFYRAKKELTAGIPVKLVRKTFRGTTCYAIYADGMMIGYVPKRLVLTIDRLGRKTARLSLVDIYAVPWKRYEVNLRT